MENVKSSPSSLYFTPVKFRTCQIPAFIPVSFITRARDTLAEHSLELRVVWRDHIGRLYIQWYKEAIKSQNILFTLENSLCYKRYDSDRMKKKIVNMRYP